MNRFTLHFALIGESGVGKSTFVSKHATGEHILKWCKGRFDDDATRISFNTPLGGVSVFVKEYCVDHGGIHALDEDVNELDGVMVMFDQTKPDTMWNALSNIETLHRSYPGLPIVLMGGKSDVRKRKFYSDDVKSEASNLGVEYDEVSSYTNLNIEMPVLRLIREALGQPELNFTPFQEDAPPRVDTSHFDMDKIWAEIEKANNTPFPDLEVELMDELTQQEKTEMKVHSVRNVSMLHHFHATLGRIQPRAKL